jgi:antitoxin VapB
MTLNIDNEEAGELAHNLAELTGESLADAVTEAIRERLERVQREKDTGLADRLLLIGKDCAAHLNKSISSDDDQESLYDEHGLPRRS